MGTNKISLGVVSSCQLISCVSFHIDITLFGRN